LEAAKQSAIWATATLRGGNLRAVKIDNIEISPQTIKDKTYPLARTLYLVTFGNPKPGAQAYMDFVKGSEGQKIAEENGFIPVEAPAIQRAHFKTSREYSSPIDDEAS
jgi:ABC-type phosphate transport system substrate-binding protein